MTKCSICAHADLAAIDDLLSGGANQKGVAQQFGVSRFALSRHLRHSKSAPAPEPGTGETLEVQATRWLQRADDIYATSTENGDVRGQVQSLTAAFRGLELQHRAELRTAQSAPPAGADAPVTIEMMDEILQRTEAEIAATPRGRALSELQSASDRFLEIAGQLYHDPELLREVEQRCATRSASILN